jgi:hypothetical protein
MQAMTCDRCRYPRGGRALHAHVEPAPGIQLIEHIETHGAALFRAIADGDHEASSPSAPTRRIELAHKARRSRSRTRTTPGATRDIAVECGHLHVVCKRLTHDAAD